MITMGILMAYILGCIVSVRVVSAVCLGIPIIFGFCIYFCPESPTFLVINFKLSSFLSLILKF